MSRDFKTQDKSALQRKVGIFVFTGIALLALCLFLLGEDNAIITSYYQVKVKMKQVQGLRPGSIVSLAGVKVGNIAKIDFSPQDGQLELFLDIKSKYQNLVRKGSVASLRTQGALGDKFIYIAPSDSSNPALNPGDYLVPEAGEGLLETLTERGQEVEKVFDILNELHILLSRINTENRSEKVMSNLVASSQDLKGMLAQTKGLVLDLRTNLAKNQDMTESFARLSSILEKIDEGEGTLGALVNDPSLHTRLKTLFGGSPRTRHLKSLIRTTIQKSEEVESRKSQ